MLTFTIPIFSYLLLIVTFNELFATFFFVVVKMLYSGIPKHKRTQLNKFRRQWSARFRQSAKR